VGLLKRIFIFILAAIAIAAAVWLVGSRLMGAPESKEKSVRWPFGLGTIADVSARFPKASNDATAEHVKAIARQFTARDRTLRPAIQSYLSKELARPNDDVEAPVAAIRHLLDEHVVAIDELRTTLGGGAPPRWAIDIDQRRQETTVDLSEQMWLIRVLAVDALDHHSRGDDATAWRDAETAWMLAQGLWAQPNLYSRTIALSGTRIANAVAAKLATPAPAWHEQLLAFDADRRLAAGMQFESWLAMTQWSRVVPPPAPANDEAQIWRGAAGAIVRRMRAQGASKYAQKMRIPAEEIERTHSCGGAQIRSGMPYAEGIRSRIEDFHIERDAAAKLLALKEQRRRSGSWPESTSGFAVSFCGADAWRYLREADGSMSLSFVKPVEEEIRRSALLPFSFRYPK
jgi:hypothetical protein